jgi:L-lysine 2,3-aminomutase
LFKKIKDGVRYENAGMQPYMETQYVNTIFLLILNTCAIHDVCRYWQRRTPVKKNWVDFRRDELNGSSASSQALPVGQDITLQM